MIYLLSALAALMVGPAAYRTLSRNQRALALLDGLVYVAVPSLVLLHLAPEVLGERQIWPLVAMAVGVFVPLWLEHQTHRIGDRADRVALLLGVAGLGLHALLEGAGLNAMARSGDVPLATAVMLHRVPVGLAIWWLLRPRFGAGIAVGAIAGLMTATMVGWGAGAGFTAGTENGLLHLFEAFVGGTLIHVIFHGRPAATNLSDDRLALTFEGMGGLLGILLVGGLAWSGIEVGPNAAIDFGGRFLGLALESAPALVLAYVAAGLLSAFLPTGSIRWMGRGGHLSSAARGMAVGLPMPVCSCGVVPLYETLVRKGAPPAAALAFLIATPELGLDAIFLSVPLLGGQMTLLRVVVAAVAALFVGWAVGRVLEPSKSAEAETEVDEDSLSFNTKLRSGLSTGLKDVVDHTAPWIILGLLVAAAATPFLEGRLLAELTTPWDVLVFTLIGLPTYVCASSATPLVAALMAGGLSPGAAIAFLITGPATNLTTFGVVSGLHGRKGALLFAGTIIGFSVVTGVAINTFVGDLALPAFDEILADDGTLLQRIALVALIILFGASLLRRGVRKSLGELKSGLRSRGHSHSHSHSHREGDAHDGDSEVGERAATDRAGGSGSECCDSDDCCD